MREDWLFKAHPDSAVVDVLHRLVGVPVDQDLIGRAEEHDVLGLRLPVLPPTDVVITQMLAMSEHYCDFGSLLPGVRCGSDSTGAEPRPHTSDGNPAPGVEAGASRSSKE